jgi:WD40 repeat protein
MDMTQVDTVMATASCIAIDNADSHALIGSSDGQIRVIDIAGKYEFRLGQNSPVCTAVFSPDGRRVVSAGYKNLYVWDLNQARLLYRVKKHDSFITKILFDHSGKVIITASKDNKIIMSDMSYGMSIATYLGHNAMDQLKITSDGGKVLFVPDIVNYIGVLEPNPALRKIMDGDRTVVRNSLRKAKAMALSFSSQKIGTHTSHACNIL